MKMSLPHEYSIYSQISSIKSEKTHPKLQAIISHIQIEFSSFKYTIYRCAIKIHTLKTLLYTSCIPYNLVCHILDRHRQKTQPADKSGTVFPVLKLDSILHDIFFAGDGLGYFNEISAFDLSMASDVLTNFLWNVFDCQSTGPITLLELKTTFLILCNVGSVEQMVYGYFRLGATTDGNLSISKARFEQILQILAKILAFIGEGDSYGLQVVPKMVEECFSRCNGRNSLNETEFNYLWTETQTKFTIYVNLLALVQRVKILEKFTHYVSCNGCESSKIVGIRFKCETCKKVTLCLECFCKGYYNSKHTKSHHMFEVFSEGRLPRFRWTHILSKLCNIFFTNNEQSETDDVEFGELAVEHSQVGTDARQIVTHAPKLGERRKQLHLTSSSGSAVVAKFAADESYLFKLQHVVQMLNDQQEKLENNVMPIIKAPSNEIDKNLGEFLEQHRKCIANITQQLRFILKTSKGGNLPTSSTPYRYNLTNPIDFSVLAASLNGIEINRSYLEANSSELSISDISTWFNHKRTSTVISPPKFESFNVLKDDVITDTQMHDFRELLSKVKEILEDSYSDNAKLSEATSNLEKVLDNIIKDEEDKRRYFIYSEIL